jgi:DNA-binding response OmpR family regulator
VKILIAEDDPVSRRVLEITLKKWGHELTVCVEGAEAWRKLQEADAAPIAILDWMMPELSGPEICKKLRESGRGTHVLLLTAKGEKQDVADGLMAGADDYITKPFDSRELRARVHVAVRLVELQQALAEHVTQLVAALASVKQLQGMLPICMYCKKVRDDSNYWQQVEHYVSKHSEAKVQPRDPPGLS